MPCLPFLNGIVCVRGGRKQKSVPCFVRDCRRPSEVLCDWIISRPKGPTIEGKIEPIRCSRPCCRHHAKHVAADKDLCLEHALEGKKVGAIK